jgi:hypothetical protein
VLDLINKYVIVIIILLVQMNEQWCSNCVGTEKAAGPNQQQGTSSQAQTPGRCSTP